MDFKKIIIKLREEKRGKEIPISNRIYTRFIPLLKFIPLPYRVTLC